MVGNENSDEIIRTYNIVALPTLVLIDADGEVKGKHTGLANPSQRP